jgi:hypothetical protein
VGIEGTAKIHATEFLQKNFFLPSEGKAVAVNTTMHSNSMNSQRRGIYHHSFWNSQPRNQVTLDRYDASQGTAVTMSQSQPSRNSSQNQFDQILQTRRHDELVGLVSSLTERIDVLDRRTGENTKRLDELASYVQSAPPLSEPSSQSEMRIHLQNIDAATRRVEGMVQHLSSESSLIVSSVEAVRTNTTSPRCQSISGSLQRRTYTMHVTGEESGSDSADEYEEIEAERTFTFSEYLSKRRRVRRSEKNNEPTSHVLSQRGSATSHESGSRTTVTGEGNVDTGYASDDDVDEDEENGHDGDALGLDELMFADNSGDEGEGSLEDACMGSMPHGNAIYMRPSDAFSNDRRQHEQHSESQSFSAWHGNGDVLDSPVKSNVKNYHPILESSSARHDLPRAYGQRSNSALPPRRSSPHPMALKASSCEPARRPRAAGQFTGSRGASGPLSAVHAHSQPKSQTESLPISAFSPSQVMTDPIDLEPYYSTGVAAAAAAAAAEQLTQTRPEMQARMRMQKAHFGRGHSST